MGVMRVNKNDNFTVMSNHHFKEKGLSLKAKGLLSLMLSLPPEWNYTVSGLVKLSKDGKDSIMSALSELEKFGYLTRERVKDDKGQFAGVEYNIYELPQLENPIAENPISEKPISENPPQLNTNVLNTNKLNTNLIYILDSIKNKNTRELFKEYINMRSDYITATGLKLLIARSEKLANGDEALQQTMIENAIINNYKNIYLPNDTDANNELAEKKRFYNL